eukprot:8187844-Ditylum_brightwellii.AAC.1
MLKYFIISAYHPDSDQDQNGEEQPQLSEVLCSVYAHAPPDDIIISGEDINAKLGKTVLVENKDISSPHPHHKITGPFSAYMHSNDYGKK